MPCMQACACARGQVVRDARRLGMKSVRGNHDEAAVAAYRAWQQSGQAPARALPLVTWP
jgi:hypothetical protein